MKVEFDHYGYPAHRSDCHQYETDEPAAGRLQYWQIGSDTIVDINEAFTGSYLTSDDLRDRGEVKVAIESVRLETMSGGQDHGKVKPVMYFVGKTKGMVINVTNKETLIANFGTAETADWIGRQITIYVAQTTFQGKPVPGLRVKLNNPEAVQLPTVDDIPF